MAFTDENGGTNTTMLVQPSGFSGGGFGNSFGGDGWWLILLFLLIGGNGWGGGFGGGFGNDLYPWMNNSQNINSGFRDQMLNTQISGIQNGITSGFGDLQTALCGGFAGVNASIANGFAQSEIAANARQISDLQQQFALQTQMANCCCENKAGLADLRYTVATEACADRNAVSSALRDVLTATQAQTQTILDKMCQQEIDALKAQNVALQNQVNMQNLAASQAAQTAALVADNTMQTQYIVNRVAPYPIPSYTVANPTTPAA